jgi:RHS repeat-associated protein
MSTETRTIGGVSKGLSYDYNFDGSLYKLHYPSQAIITYTPWNNGSNAVSWPSDAKDAGNAINYATGAAYNAAGTLTGFVSGNTGGFAGITNTFTFNKRLQPVLMSASSPSQTVFAIGYDFHLGAGDNGNAYSIANNRDHTRDQTFTYDQLNRLISAQNAGTDCNQKPLNPNQTKFWGNSYTYDAWGNLLSKSVTKCTAENLSVPVGNENRLQGGYTYDAAGNMTWDPTDGVTSTYDQENRIATATKNGVTTTYTYDDGGNRAKKSNGTTGTIYWYMAPGIVAESDLVGNLTSEYLFFAAERVARKDYPSNAVSYYFSDHLKTASVVTDSVGNIKSESDYYPWGGELQFVNSDSNHYKFTGKERDVETGLDYFGARYYSNGLARWITPDKPFADQHVQDPQTWNLYMYGRNNPTIFIDEDGDDIKYAPGLKNAEDVKAVVDAILANPNTSGTYSGYVGPNNPDLTITSGDLSGQDVTNANGSVTTHPAETEIDITPASTSTSSFAGGTPTTTVTPAKLNGAVMTIDNRTSPDQLPEVLLHEGTHVGDAKKDPGGYLKESKEQTQKYPKPADHDKKSNEARANDFAKKYEKEIAKQAKELRKQRKEEEKRKKEEEKKKKRDQQTGTKQADGRSDKT